RGRTSCVWTAVSVAENCPECLGEYAAAATAAVGEAYCTVVRRNAHALRREFAAYTKRNRDLPRPQRAVWQDDGDKNIIQNHTWRAAHRSPHLVESSQRRPILLITSVHHLMR
ncbi:unnamed protein product, partial [Sphacelaria rigidula]